VCLLLLVIDALLMSTGSRAAVSNAHASECEYGVALALAGQTAKAESVFISLLSHSPGSPAAFTNLGNLRLLRGDLVGSLAFYDRAFAADSDAGIVLNEATALLLLGDDEGAEERAHLGVEMARSATQAASLLGLHDPAAGAAQARAGEHAQLSKEEVLNMIRAAAGRVPSDSTRVVTPPAPGATHGHSVKWRPAGPRAGETAPSTLVYWKR